MATLNITPDMIRALHDSQTGRPDRTGIVVGCDGWEIRVWTEKGPSAELIALTTADVHAWLGGEDMDDDAAQALTNRSEGGDYQIPHEDGGLHEPDETAEPQVVTGKFDADDNYADDSSELAYWFDLSQAVELISEKLGGTSDRGRAWSLWRTAGGRYVQRTFSDWAIEPDESWDEVSLVQAVDRAYGADDYQMADDLPIELAAARMAASIVAELAAPELTPDSDLDVYSARARRHAADAVHVAEACQAVSELLRVRVQSDLRRERSAAARVVYHAEDGDRSAAAKRLGIAYSTFANLANLSDQ